MSSVEPWDSSRPAARTILLISVERQLHETLKFFANTVGLMVVRVAHATGTVAVLKATQPGAVLLDLDLPDEAAWETADLLLDEPSCPPVILLAGRTEQFDTRTAIRAGSLVSKSDSAARVLEIVQEALELPEVNRAERNAIQRVLIRRLRRSDWADETAPAHRFWGINE